MPLDAATFEKLGMFYLGRTVDPATGTPTDEPLLLDSRDLVTHAVCVGMTGSGKTGLGIALLEEAAIDGLPALIIDPKGDLANLALPLADLTPGEFAPWVSADEAARAGVTPEVFAEQQAQLWRDGLAGWGQDPARVARLKSAAEVAVFTPGSTAGRPISVLASFDAPPPAVLADPELLAERVDSTAAALLGLAGIGADPVTSREHTLVATILANAWGSGESLTLEELLRRIQRPPFTTIGVLDVGAFYPEADRFKLVLALNNLLASPGFASWRNGAPLDVQSLLFTPEGRPRLAVISIAHLGDAERMFFVAMLLNAAVSWMRAQSGTTSLRALLYMDEVFGYFPPVANPPSKRPLLTLLKQARAFGFGVVLSTQNPADLDYKGLANAGIWMIGRLQTERDRARLLDGLGEAGAADREQLAAMLTGLGKRRFVLRSVHEPTPILFETRWTLTYLRGPLTRDQIRSLTPASVAVPAAAAAPAFRSGPPMLKDVTQRFERGSAERWRPGLLVEAMLTFRDARRGLDETEEVAWFAPFAGEEPDWDGGEAVDATRFDAQEAAGEFEELPAAARNAKSYAGWSRDVAPWLATTRAREIRRCPALKLESRPGESERDFQARLTLRLHEERDARADAVRQRFARRFETLGDQVRRANEAVVREQAQAGQAGWQTALAVGTTLLGAFLGRKAVSASTLGRASTAARGVGRTMKEAGEVGTAKERLAAVEAKRAALDAELAAELAEVSRALAAPEVEIVRIAPAKSGVRVRSIALAWRAAG